MKIEVNAEFLFELKNKEEWIIKVPKILPKKVRAGESWVWLDKNGSVFELGRDFEAADKLGTFPCKVYRLINVAGHG